MYDPNKDPLALFCGFMCAVLTLSFGAQEISDQLALIEEYTAADVAPDAMLLVIASIFIGSVVTIVLDIMFEKR